MDQLATLLRAAGDTLSTRRDILRFLGAGALAATVGGAPKLLNVASAQDGAKPEIIIGVQGLPAALDPMQAGFSVVAARTLYSVYDYIIEADYLKSDSPGLGSELIPSLATEWSRIDDLTLEIKLRTDVTFHDGTPFTANDVKFTFDRVIGPDADPLLQTGISQMSTIDHVDVIDDYTVRFVTKAPDAALEQRFTYGILWPVPMAAVEAAGNEAFSLAPIGTGPYKVTDFVVGDRLVLEAYDGYWGSPAAFSKVTYRAIPEAATRIAAVRSNEVQLVTNVTPDQVVEIENDSSLAISSIAIANCHIYHFNTKHPNVANKLVRQALNIGFDRELIINSLWRGEADIMNSFQLPRWGDFYNPERPYPTYDPERAKALLEEGGYSDAEIVYRTGANYYTLTVDVAQAIVSMWQDLGVKASILVMEDTSEDPENLMIKTWSNSIAPGDPSVAFWQWWGPNGSPQKGGLWVPEDPRFNGELADTVLGSADQTARAAAYQQMLDIWDDEAPAAILYNQHEMYIQRADTNWQPYTIYGIDLREQAIKQ